MASGTITLAMVQSQLSTWLDASSKLAAGQTISINGRHLTRSNAQEVMNMIDYWSKLEARFLTAADAPAGQDPTRAGFALASFNPSGSRSVC